MTAWRVSTPTTSIRVVGSQVEASAVAERLLREAARAVGAEVFTVRRNGGVVSAVTYGGNTAVATLEVAA